MPAPALIITGSEGFIGRSVSKRFPDAIRFDLKIEPFFDIKSHSAVEKFWAENKPSTVIHLAANPRPNLAASNAIQDAEVNILGTINVLEASLRFGVKRFVYASTAQVVGPSARLPVHESDTCNPQSPYAISKYVGEQYCRYYAKSGLPVTVLRFFNVYGPNQAIGFAVPDIVTRIHQARADDIVEVKGPPDDSRDYVYVDDVAEAVFLACQRDFDDETINVGSGQETTTSSLYETVASVLRKSVKLKYSDRLPGRVPGRFKADIEKAKIMLGWSPKTTLRDGLTRVANSLGYHQ